MRKNISQQYALRDDGRIYFEGDWYGKGIPGNVSLGENFYFSSSQGFERIYSNQKHALEIGDEVGLYDQFSFEIGEVGRVKIGDYSIINSARIRCVNHVSIGKYCMVSWGTYISDSWLDSEDYPIIKNKKTMSEVDKINSLGHDSPVVLEDNVWIGFGCVILPGVTIGEGSIVSSKSVVKENVPPNTIVGGQPLRVLKSVHDGL